MNKKDYRPVMQERLSYMRKDLERISGYIDYLTLSIDSFNKKKSDHMLWYAEHSLAYTLTYLNDLIKGEFYSYIKTIDSEYPEMDKDHHTFNPSRNKRLKQYPETWPTNNNELDLDDLFDDLLDENHESE